MATTTVTEDNFSSLLEQQGIVFFDFWAPWCGPCRMFGPVFEAASEQHADIMFAKINTEEEVAIASALKIQSIPTLMAMRDGILVFRQAGALPAPAFDELIDAVRGLDMDEVRAEVAKEHAQASATA